MGRSTETKINEVAIRLFLEKGYAQVTINDICDACGITKPTFYKHAGCKENLILDFYDRTIHDLLIDTYHFLEAGSHYEQLVLVFRTLIQITKKYGQDLFSQMFISNLADDHHSFDMRDSLTKLCIVIIRNAQKAGEIGNKGDAEVLYRSIAYMFTGYECMWCIKKGELDWEEEFLESTEELLQVREDMRITKKPDGAKTAASKDTKARKQG